jgi:FtsZ-binding cell division protein ZapB
MSEYESSGGGHEGRHNGEAAVLTVSANDFSALEERVLRAVDVVRRERHARVAAEERAAQAESEAHEHAGQLEQLEKEVSALRSERDHVRERVERLLGQLDALEL